MPGVAIILLLLPMIGCKVDEPSKLPTAERVGAAEREMARSVHPPLYQLLYDYSFLPEVQFKGQRVRLLIWLRHMRLSEWQLRSLKDLAGKVTAERERIGAAQAAVVQSYEPKVGRVYDTLWEQLQNGGELDAQQIEEAAGALLGARLQHSREKELLELRIQGVRSVKEMEREWLNSLDPRQEAVLVDAIFLLRHRLDPYANPGDFRQLVGSIYVAGEWGSLTRGSFNPETDHLNIGGLWSEVAMDDYEGPIFNDARREILLYMALLEPALPTAVDAALTALKNQENQENPGAGAVLGDPPR
jgi:hypothetical protein